MESSFLPGSSKRAKAPGSMSLNVRCLVDGCNADLTLCRDYHRRHKVCESHSKSPKVTIGGKEQRFCQQCSRFHSLAEFDEVKRSCRKRLDGHNRRRRKPQPELSRSPDLLLSNQQGTRVLPLSSPQIYSTAVISSSWTSMIKPQNDFVLYDNRSNLNSSNTYPESPSVQGHKGGNHIQFMQNTESSVCQPLLEWDTRCGHTNSSQNIFSSVVNQVTHSDSALSLLSSRNAPTREVGFNNSLVQPDSMSSHSRTEPLVHPSQFGSPGQFLFTQEVGTRSAVSEVDSQASSNATCLFQEMFQNGPDESSTSVPHQTLTFLWE